jgi:hypothetical protein
MEKLAAITPRPAVNLVIYHGVLVPRDRWRAAIIAEFSWQGVPTAPMTISVTEGGRPAQPRHHLRVGGELLL